MWRSKKMVDYIVRCEVLNKETFEPADPVLFPPIEQTVFALNDEGAREQASAYVPSTYEFFTVVSYLRYKNGDKELSTSQKKWQETEYIDENLNKSIVKRVRIIVPRNKSSATGIDDL
jgi:hypothetical protein